MKLVYLSLAIVGAVVPFIFFGQHFGREGYELSAFLKGIFATPAASGFASDLLITSLVFWIFMFNAGRNAPKPWLYIFLNIFVGLSCALPAYFCRCHWLNGDAKLSFDRNQTEKTM